MTRHLAVSAMASAPAVSAPASLLRYDPAMRVDGDGVPTGKKVAADLKLDEILNSILPPR